MAQKIKDQFEEYKSDVWDELIKSFYSLKKDRDQLRAILDGMAIKGLMEGESDIDGLHRLLNEEREKNSALEQENFQLKRQLSEVNRAKEANERAVEIIASMAAELAKLDIELTVG